MKEETKQKYIEFLDNGASVDIVVDVRVDKDRLEKLIDQNINLELLRKWRKELGDADIMDNLAGKITAMNAYVYSVEFEMLLETPKYEYEYRKVCLLDAMLAGDKYYPYFIQLTRQNKETENIDSYRVIVDEQALNTEIYSDLKERKDKKNSTAKAM